jgi:hypothetical protein
MDCRVGVGYLGKGSLDYYLARECVSFPDLSQPRHYTGYESSANYPLSIGLYTLMSYMHAQRRKALGKGSRLGGKAKVA